MVEHRHPELGLRAVVVTVEVLEPPCKLVRHKAQPAGVLVQYAVHRLRGDILHREAQSYRLGRVLLIAICHSFFRRQLHRRVVASHRLGIDGGLFSVKVNQRLHREAQRVALVGAGRAYKGNEKNGIFFPAGDMLNLVGVADCGSHRCEHRPREIVFRKADSGVGLVDYAA